MTTFFSRRCILAAHKFFRFARFLPDRRRLPPEKKDPDIFLAYRGQIPVDFFIFQLRAPE
jgi:hypothetical protein